MEASQGFAIDRGWMEQLALHTQVVIKQSRLNYNHGRLLYAVLRRYLAECRSAQAAIFVTGTARGFSALCMALALQDAGAGGYVRSEEHTSELQSLTRISYAVFCLK